MKKINFSDFLINLTQISPRRGTGEKRAADLIEKQLHASSIPYTVQEFSATIPVTITAELKADGKQIPCLGASFVSGEFTKETKIVNSFESDLDEPMIIFNPVSHGVCQQTFKSSPALAINRDSVVELVMAKTVSGIVEVRDEEFLSKNILVGNIVNPQQIVFAHYDSLVGTGAVDNAAAVDVLLQTIIDYPHLTSKNLFVFAGSEEESTSRKVGFHGFEEFDKKYSALIDKATKILILDGSGLVHQSLQEIILIGFLAYQGSMK